MGQWSELPGDLLNAIDGHLNSYGDKVRFCAVCVSWNSHLPKVRIPLPRLLQAFENQSSPTHGLFNLHEKKFDLLDLPELQGKLFKGSSYGWVVAIDDSPGRTSPDIFLINPLTRVQIQLPPRCTFPDVKEYNVDNVDNEYTLLSPEGPYPVYSNFVHLNLTHKVVLSSSPLSEDCIVVAIYGEYGSLAWCSCNDNSWTSLGYSFAIPFKNQHGPFTDVLFYKGRLHALTQSEMLIYENIGGPNQKITKILPAPVFHAYPTYLVDSFDGELLVVARYVDLDDGVFDIDAGVDVDDGVDVDIDAGVDVVDDVDVDVDVDIDAGVDVADDVDAGENVDIDVGGDNVDDGGFPPLTTLRTEGFEVYKFDSINSSWLEVKNIGDEMLFLGFNLSLSISSRKFPGYKGNCIYFTGCPRVFGEKGSKVLDSDIGIFNLEDGSFESLPGFKCVPKFLWPPPVWVYDVEL